MCSPFRLAVFVWFCTGWFFDSMLRPREGPRSALDSLPGASGSPQAHIKKHKNSYFCRARLSGRVAEDPHEGGVVRPRTGSQVSGVSAREVWDVVFNPLGT